MIRSMLQTVNRILELCKKHKVVAAMHTGGAKFTPALY